MSSKSSTRELATKSTLTFTLNESCGVINVDNVQHESVQETAQFKGQVFKVCMTILLLALLVGGWYFYGVYQKRAMHMKNVEWLTEFYQQNAPQKLEDPQMIERTLTKYKENMFVLWRQLERAYGIKWKPPTTIIDNDDGF
mmetsp:Transcript_23753/g.34830  ORF Transcript_23753/g.34830 Transcript_23753/m.34830 type:complete len:141 (+) Transcript_23753:1850-2272(+)